VTVFYDFIQLTCLGFAKDVAGFGKANIHGKFASQSELVGFAFLNDPLQSEIV
jgi:hypothetical protein